MSRCHCCKAQKKRVVGRRHAPRECKRHHPLGGHGYLKERGWTDPEAERQHGLEVEARTKK
jgi:hypothetical protein